MKVIPVLWKRLDRVVREYWLALVVLFVPLNWVVYQSDADNVVPFLILPAVAVAVGFLLRPGHVWLVWLASVFILWVIIAYMGKFNDNGSGETPASVMFESFIWMFMGVFIPVWVGRFIHDMSDRWRHVGPRSTGKVS